MVIKCRPEPDLIYIYILIYLICLQGHFGVRIATAMSHPQGKETIVPLVDTNETETTIF